MKLDKKILLGSSAALVALSPLAAQQLRAAVATVPAQATIAEAIAFSGTVGMNFGALTEAGAGGTAALDFADTVTPGAGVFLVGGTPSTGEVKITASIGTVLDISLNGALPIALKTTGSAATMNITDIQFLYNGVNGTAITAPVVANPDTLLVGGTLAVGAGQKAGIYKGNVKIDVVYQ